jgi:proton-translocating NADH-quinone oxidoreductase chain M
VLLNAILLPLLGSFLIFFIDSDEVLLMRFVALLFSLLTFFSSVFLWVGFDKSTTFFQFSTMFEWAPSLNLYFILGIDGLSLFFILFTTFIIPLCLLIFFPRNKNLKEYFILILLIEFLLLLVFSVLDVFLFFIFFESILIPVFAMVGIFGSGERKIRSSYMFFCYTLFGSIFMLVSLLYLHRVTGTFDYTILNNLDFSLEAQKMLWLGFSISFLIKVPVVPFHIWLPEAHVEAPTGGSVLLASILLKMGSYGLIRFSVSLFPLASFFYMPLIFFLVTLSVVYSSLSAIRQIDLKRIVAYTSIAHMNVIVFGIFCLNIYSLEGSLLLMLSHGVVSGGLFFCVGMIYSRLQTRLTEELSGLAQFMPVLVFFLFMFTLGNVSVPGTFNFLGEFLIFVGTFAENSFITCICALGIVLSSLYSLWFFNRISYGNTGTSFLKYRVGVFDLTESEIFILTVMLYPLLLVGIYPNDFVDLPYTSLLFVVERSQEGALTP